MTPRSCTLCEGVLERIFVDIFDFGPYLRNAAFLDQTVIVDKQGPPRDERSQL